MLYLSMTVTAASPTQLQYRAERLASFAKHTIAAEPEPNRAIIRLSGDPHGNILLIRNLSEADPLKLRDASPQLLEVVEKIVKNCYDPLLRVNGDDLKASLLGVRMTMQDIRDAAEAIHAATGRIIEIPAHAPQKDDHD